MFDGGFDTSFKQIGDLEYNYRLLQRGNFISSQTAFAISASIQTVGQMQIAVI